MSGLVAILGSPRAKGNSTILAREALAGAASRGAQTATVRLHGMDIRPCSACESCRNPPGSDCAVRDDMQGIYPVVRGASALLLASPVYWFSLSAQTKLFLDRCYALDSPAGHGLKGKRVGLILTYGDEDCLLSGAMNALRTIEDACRYTGAIFLGAVHGCAGEAGAVRADAGLLERARDLGERLART